MLALLENDDILMLEKVEREGRATLALYQPCKNQYDLIDFVADLLRSEFPMTAIELTNTEYRPGLGYVMIRPNEWDIYIKLRITDCISQPKLHFLSFHRERPG